MLPSVYEVLAAGCKLLGYSLNTRDAQELAKVRELLLKQRKLLKGYLDYVTIEKLLVTEELWAAHMYSGEGTRVSGGNRKPPVRPSQRRGRALAGYVRYPP